MSPPPSHADAWGLPRVLEFFESARATTDQVYPSEWLFLRDRLKEGMTVLDVGCAQGGFAAVLGEHLETFSYTGVDINPDMVLRAREKYPDHTFHRVPEGDLSVLGAARFDLVLILGILHLHEAWRDTVAAAWARTGGCLLLDLRECSGPSVEDRETSFMRMDFHGGGDSHARVTLPYIVMNAGEALQTLEALCPGHARISRFGYTHPATSAAVCPVARPHVTTYCIET